MSEAKGEARPSMMTKGAPAEDAERSLGRAVAVGLPVACLLVAGVVTVSGSIGSALLVLASGALLGAITLVWASLRTLSGEAPLGVDLESVAAAAEHSGGDLAEEKRRVLRALKDLEGEHSLGRMDDADYAELVGRYRDEAKAVMRKMDEQAAPMHEEAERVAQQYLERRGVRRARCRRPPRSSRRGPRLRGAAVRCVASRTKRTRHFARRAAQPSRVARPHETARSRLRRSHLGSVPPVRHRRPRGHGRRASSGPSSDR